MSKKYQNEWEFVQSVDNQIKKKGRATYKILEGTKDLRWDFIFQDEVNNTYEAHCDEEGQEVFMHLLKDRKLIFEVDIPKNTVTYKVNSGK